MNGLGKVVGCGTVEATVPRVDYCNAVFAGLSRYITDKLKCVLNAAARLVTGTRNFDNGLSHLLHEKLH